LSVVSRVFFEFFSKTQVVIVVQKTVENRFVTTPVGKIIDGRKTASKRFLVPVQNWIAVEKQETDPQLFCKREYCQSL
jgi:hypothetical protein